MAGLTKEYNALMQAALATPDNIPDTLDRKARKLIPRVSKSETRHLMFATLAGISATVVALVTAGFGIAQEWGTVGILAGTAVLLFGETFLGKKMADKRGH